MSGPIAQVPVVGSEMPVSSDMRSGPVMWIGLAAYLDEACISGLLDCTVLLELLKYVPVAVGGLVERRCPLVAEPTVHAGAIDISTRQKDGWDGDLEGGAAKQKEKNAWFLGPITTRIRVANLTPPGHADRRGQAASARSIQRQPLRTKRKRT